MLLFVEILDKVENDDITTDKITKMLKEKFGKAVTKGKFTVSEWY